LKISVLAPAYNEEDHIGKFIDEAEAVMDGLGLDYEIIVVDDGSTDRTREVAQQRASNPRVKVVGYRDNMGKGYALRQGFAHATGELLLLLDSDMDISPKQITRYIGASELGDVVIGSKWHPKSRTEMPCIRRFLSHGFHLMVILLTGLRVSDTQSGMKAFRRKVLERVLPRLAMKRFAFDVEFLTVANLKRFRIVEYPIEIKMTGPAKLGPLVKTVWSMFWEILGITYRLRVLKWYHKK